MAINDPHLHHRRSIRLKGYDYSQPGAYFITLVTYHRDCLFGSVVDGKMQLSALGEIVRDEWMRSIGIRKEIRLNTDEFVVMPNHLHGIGWIVTSDVVKHVGADSTQLVGADGVRPMIRVYPDNNPDNGVRPMIRVYPDNNPDNGVRPMIRVHPDDVRPNKGASITPIQEEGAYHAPLRRKPRSISSFIAGFKASVTRRAGNDLNITGIWQRNYYDHIIRDEQDFRNIWNYIDTNPLLWTEDQLHPSLMNTGASLSPQRINQE
jgi:putative transposase